MNVTGVDAAIGDRVHQRMWRAQLSNTEVARALGVDRAALGRRLRGRTSWRVTDLLIVAELLGVTLEQLLPSREEIAALAAEMPQAVGDETGTEFRRTSATRRRRLGREVRLLNTSSAGRRVGSHDGRTARKRTVAPAVRPSAQVVDAA